MRDISGYAKRCGLLFLAALSASTGAGQQFLNLDFERPGAPAITPDGIWLSWTLAAPGWAHPKGGDSAFVYHNTPPLSTIAQFYFLIDGSATKWSPLEGNCSLALVSGHYNRADSASPWVEAFIEQTATVPQDAKSFRLLATGDFSLTLDSQKIPLFSLGGDAYGADVSGFAGQQVTVRVANEATEIQSPVIVDGMRFSTEPIPEPGTLSLLGGGLAATLLLRARRQRRAA